MQVIGWLGEIWIMLAFAKSSGTNPEDLAGDVFAQPEGVVQYESKLFFFGGLPARSR